MLVKCLAALDGDRSALATSPRCRSDCPPTIFFVHSFTALCLRRSDAHNVAFSNRRSTGSGKLLTSGSSADLVLASHPRRSPTCLQERCYEETLTFQGSHATNLFEWWLLYFFYSCYLLCNLRWIAITHKV